MIETGQLFNAMPEPSSGEVFERLLETPAFRLERIVSTGQQTPPGEWYDQDRPEWVVLLSGSARLRFEDPAQLIEMSPGQWVHIPAHSRHRVEWTDPNVESIWIALHYLDDRLMPLS